MASAPADRTQTTPIVELEEVASTNLEALRRAAAGERGPLWITARRQTAGRGRSGRAWISAEGNLAATLLLAPGCAPAQLHQLSLLAGVAACDALVALRGKQPAPLVPPGVGVRLKWPNDILLGGAKLGGILIESMAVGGEIVAVIGVGINVAAAPEIEGRATAVLADAQAAPSPRAVLEALDARMCHWLDIWAKGAGFAAVRAGWLACAGPIGESISVDTGAETITGSFAGIDETGALCVSSVPPKPGEFRRITFGDVSLLLPPQDQG